MPDKHEGSETSVAGIPVRHKIIDGFDTWSWTNPKTGDRLRLRHTLKDRLQLYVDHGKTGEYFVSSAPPIMCGDHPQAVAHAWIAGKLPDYWRGVGRAAFANGEPSAPALNATVRACMDVPAGTRGAQGTRDIMRWYTEGWTAANLDAPTEQ